MYLKSLVLKGFKSFADRSVLALEPGITAIVGPNGSGKSNVLDAVLWVLGERNARNLRGQAMEDVIFAGSSTRKQVGIAEVDLVLDNTDGTLPVDFSEVRITRRMYRSGESEYLINGTLARRMDVLDILHDSGMGTGTHSIISQGHLDSILQSKPEDRRSLIEEAAGVLKHKQRKAKSERKLAQMDQHLLRIKDITAEVERQVKPLERKAKRALAYQGLADELAELTLSLAVDDLRTLQAKWDATCGREQELNAAITENAAEVARLDALLEELQASLQKQTENAGEVADGFHRMNNVSERVDSTIMLLREKKRSGVRFREQKNMQLASNERRIRELTAEQEKAIEQAEQAQAEKASIDAELESLKSRFDELTESLSEKETTIASLEGSERSLTTTIGALRESVRKTAEQMQESVADAKLLEAKRADLAEELDAGAKRVSTLDEQVGESDTALASHLEADEKARTRVGDAFNAVEALRTEVDSLQRERSRLDAQVAGYTEMERTRRSANHALTWLMDRGEDLGVGDNLISALDVPEAYSDIVESLLGDDTTAAFVKDAKTADIAAAKVVEGAGSGSVALIPAGLSAAATATDRFGGTPLLDVLTSDKAHADAVRALLGDVIVCDKAADAAGIASRIAELPEAQRPRLRIASCDGVIIDAHGVRRVARKDAGEVGAVERHRLLVEATRALETVSADHDRAQAELGTAEEALREAQKASLACSSVLAEARGSNSSLHDQLEGARGELDRQKQTLESLDRRVNDNRELLDRIRPDSEKTAEDLKDAETQLVSVKDRLQVLRGEVSPLRVQVSQVNEKVTEARLRANTLGERALYAQRVVDGRRQDIARVNAAIERARRTLSRKAPGDSADTIIAALEAVQATMASRSSALEAALTQARDSSGTVTARMEDVRTSAAERHGRLDAVNAQLSDVRVDKGRLEVQVEGAIAAVTQECKVPLEQAMTVPALENRTEVEEQAGKLRRRIANMGTINPDAAAEYEELKQRYDYLETQVSDMVEARASLAKIVRVIDDRMKDDFITTFYKVDENFREIFAELFPGGEARLSLIDADDPDHTGIEVNAQPRGKRITKMSLMSGGEKSLTALALLFAVYRIRSTPFYILDEVEAALDDTNLRRLCGYLEKVRHDTQLIMITHQRRTMEMSDMLYGVSMQADGVTKLVSQKLDRDRGTRKE